MKRNEDHPGFSRVLAFYKLCKRPCNLTKNSTVPRFESDSNSCVNIETKRMLFTVSVLNTFLFKFLNLYETLHPVDIFEAEEKTMSPTPRIKVVKLKIMQSVSSTASCTGVRRCQNDDELLLADLRNRG